MIWYAGDNFVGVIHMVLRKVWNLISGKSSFYHDDQQTYRNNGGPHSWHLILDQNLTSPQTLWRTFSILVVFADWITVDVYAWDGLVPIEVDSESWSQNIYKFKCQQLWIATFSNSGLPENLKQNTDELQKYNNLCMKSHIHHLYWLTAALRFNSKINRFGNSMVSSKCCFN